MTLFKPSTAQLELIAIMGHARTSGQDRGVLPAVCIGAGVGCIAADAGGEGAGTRCTRGNKD